MEPKRLAGGVVGGLAGGVLFGLMMQVMGMLEMVAGLVGQDGAGVGWVVHLGISLLFGLVYGLTFGILSSSWGRAVGLGAVYGVIWWVLGALVIMPAWMGMPVFQIGPMQLQSLAGHLVYGVALGVVFQALVQAATAREAPSHA
jgi:uncharacterized membrane protein YagU involved in acid resistance